MQMRLSAEEVPGRCFLWKRRGDQESMKRGPERDLRAKMAQPSPSLMPEIFTSRH
jgi:hypothetical protein